jgi:pimeloyl-ACP methyl ester carboxylesterase
MNGFTARMLRIGDTDWHLHESSAVPEHASPTVVFVPGLGEGDYMAPHGELLARRWRVVIADMPGFGRTRGPRRLRTTDEFAQALHGLLDAILDQPAHVVGSSFGAQIAAAAAHRGAPIDRLVLVSPTYDAAARSVLGQLWRWLPTMVVEPPTLAIGLTKSYLHCGVRTPILAFFAGLRDSIEKRLTDVTQPVLVVRGSRDRIVSATWARQLADAAPRGRLAEIDGFAHTLDYAAPRQLEDVVTPFLREPCG